MMIRKIIKIDENKCNGCGLCAEACHEGAIGMIDGKARLLRDDYCDGLGDCLPVCPTGAIAFEVREAAEFSLKVGVQGADENGKENKYEKGDAKQYNIEKKVPHQGGCPGSRAHAINRDASLVDLRQSDSNTPSRLMQWPVQIKLAPVNAPYFAGSNLLVSADCAAYAYSNFHGRFMQNKVTLIGCPKLDEVDYSDKLGEIIRENEIKSITVVRMEVPCCGGLENAVIKALKNSGKMIPWQIVTVSTDGQILEN